MQSVDGYSELISRFSDIVLSPEKKEPAEDADEKELSLSITHE